ncbi:MAG: TerD family protein [Oscillospiraceae bacterium]|nr:TerD family protein [Oscillospiraceae bacterium]
MQLQRGMRGAVSAVLDPSRSAAVTMAVNGSAEYDYTCFGLDDAGKLSDDRYMIFYNQTAAPGGEIRYSAQTGGAKFDVQLGKLPDSIRKLVFTVNIDGTQTMHMVSGVSFAMSQNGIPAMELSLTGTDFKDEKAVILIELYRRGDEWKYNCVAQGFNGGLSDLLNYFGGTEAPVPTAPAVKPAVSDLLAPIADTPKPSASGKVSLKKGQKISLKKQASGSAYIRIENGWTAPRKDYDLKALVRYRNGKTIYVGAANQDEVMMTPEGAVIHGGDIKVPGELEHIDIKWHPDIASVAVSSYSAIENGVGSFRQFGVFVRIINGDQVIEIAAADASADPKSYTLCFGEILFGTEQDSLEVSALEMYSRPSSENRIGYRKDKVVMDIGPRGRTK